MKKIAVIVLFLIAGLGNASESPAQPADLEDALWKGVLTIHVKGPMLRQFLTNRLVDDRIPVGFIKEKGEMNLDVTYRVTFLINALGEYTLLAEEQFQADQKIRWEYRHRFQEERKVKEAGIDMKVHQTVHNVKIVRTNVNFNREAQYSRSEFSFGQLELAPSGRMNKKGSLEIKGEIKATVKGVGKVITTEERQPASETFKNRRETVSIEKPYTLPITFSASIKHRKKPVEGALTVNAPVKDPFAKVEDDKRISKNFSHRVQVSGSYTLQPLFGK